MLKTALAVLMLALCLAGTPVQAAQTHKLVIHVAESEHSAASHALVFARNVHNHYASKGKRVRIVILATGGGINMYRLETSNYNESLKRLSGQMGNDVTYIACGNSMKGIAAQEGLDVADMALLKGVERVEVGVAELIRLQEKGYAYVRP